jgi:hypothetical protein
MSNNNRAFRFLSVFLFYLAFPKCAPRFPDLRELSRSSVADPLPHVVTARLEVRRGAAAATPEFLRSFTAAPPKLHQSFTGAPPRILSPLHAVITK